MNFKAFSQMFMAEHCRVVNKPSHIATNNQLLYANLLPAFGEMGLEAIRPRHILTFRSAALATGVTARTVNSRLTLLRTMLRKAWEWEVMETPPPKVAMLPFATAKRPGWGVEAMECIMATAPQPWKALVTFASRTGLRRGELAALEWSDIDFSRDVIVVARAVSAGIECSTKSLRVREVPLSKAAAAALAALPRAGKGVFVKLPDGIKYRVSGLSEGLRRACPKAGVKNLGWHGLRRAYATHLEACGVPISTIQTWMGHADISTTMRYLSQDTSGDRDAMARLDAMHQK